MKPNVLSDSSVQEGIFFLLLGGALFCHSLDAHGKGFNQDWIQSPYLFPAVVAVLTAALALALVSQGLRRQPEAGAGSDAAPPKRPGQVLVILGLTLAYYMALALLKIPYITFGILSWSLTISNFEIATVIFLLAMMLYLGVRRISVLALAPLGTSLFLSIAFRAMLHVLLP